jgi:hypothetical protein
MAELYNPYLRNDPFHRCPACKQLTDNENMCDDCHDNMVFLLRWYEAAVRPKPKPYRPDQND